MDDGVDPVAGRDHRHVLAAVAERTAQPGLEQQPQRPQRLAAAVVDRRGPQDDDAGSGLAAPARSRPARPGTRGSAARPRGSRCPRRPARRRGRRRCRSRCRPGRPAWSRWPAIASASTRVVVTRLFIRFSAHFFECGLPAVGEPARFTTTSWSSTTSWPERGDVGVPPDLARSRRSAYERGDVVAQGVQPLAQPGPEEAGRAGDEEAHGSTVACDRLRPHPLRSHWCRGIGSLP